MKDRIWRHIEESEVSAAYGLASDEYLMHTHSDHSNPFIATLKLYTYSNYSALCGRFQDMEAEIDLEACKTHNFGFGRRLTGGGAIIMGCDQLGICLTSNSSMFKWTHIRELYQLFSQPIIDALADFNIKATFRSKNDLEVGGKKIAGLGIHVSPDGGIQFHSSLLLDLDIPAMMKVLKIPIQKYADKNSIHSIEQRMTTVRREAGISIGMNTLKQMILKHYKHLLGAQLQSIPFSANEVKNIEALADDRYRSDEWLYQRSPQQDMDGMSLKKTAAGLLRTYIALKGETIKSVLITGDFMEMPQAFAQIESQLRWSPLQRDKIEAIVKVAFQEKSCNLNTLNISAEDVAEAIWLATQRAFAAKKYTYKGSCYYPKATTDA